MANERELDAHDLVVKAQFAYLVGAVVEDVKCLGGNLWTLVLRKGETVYEATGDGWEVDGLEVKEVPPKSNAENLLT